MQHKLDKYDLRDLIEEMNESNSDDRDEDLGAMYVVCYPTIESQNS